MSRSADPSGARWNRRGSTGIRVRDLPIRLEKLMRPARRT
jgi:hypothetical protein